MSRPRAPASRQAVLESTASDPLSLCVLTFVTASGRRCWYAGLAEYSDDGTPRPLRVPRDVLERLQALGARRAWVYAGAPLEICAADEAHRACAPVTRAPLAAIGRLVFD